MAETTPAATNECEDATRTWRRIAARLLDARDEQGVWTGHLSSSALSTAVAVFALACVDRQEYEAFICRGLNWLRDSQNRDGGWGDTVKSESNLSTTLLCWSAFAVAEGSAFYEHTVAQTERWLRRHVGSLEPTDMVDRINHKYGRDKTFSVPILTMCALAGRLGEPRRAWRWIRPLPFELAALPHVLYRWLNLRVVSYALPALIAMGQLRFRMRPPLCPVKRLVRAALRRRTLRILDRIQPANGGFLEATPLTGFVAMSLVEAGRPHHPVVSRAVEFLTASIREDGSWPIDTNLATWATTLSVNALTASRAGSNLLTIEDRDAILDWLLAQQYTAVHPYTHAAPGGWAWTHLPGAVPDADDTAGALVALVELADEDEHVCTAARKGLSWLVGLQNRDGGIPTFCRGWGKLPFDRSCADLTAHAAAAAALWLDRVEGRFQKRLGRSLEAMLDYLVAHQRADGAWLPLWFGNERARRSENPLYGCARVVTHLSRLPEPMYDDMAEAVRGGVQWLLQAQNRDGGFGADHTIRSSIEETALAADALASTLARVCRPDLPDRFASDQEAMRAALDRAVGWLCEHTRQGVSTPPVPIGLYFAQLWYYEDLYPLIFAAGALGRYLDIKGKAEPDAAPVTRMTPEPPAPAGEAIPSDPAEAPEEPPSAESA